MDRTCPSCGETAWVVLGEGDDPPFLRCYPCEDGKVDQTSGSDFQSGEIDIALKSYGPFLPVVSGDFDKSGDSLRVRLLAEVDSDKISQAGQIIDDVVRPIIKEAMMLDKEFALITRDQMLELALITQETFQAPDEHTRERMTLMVSSELLHKFENFITEEGFQFKYLASLYDYYSHDSYIHYTEVSRAGSAKKYSDDSESLYLDGNYNSVSRREYENGNGKVFSPVVLKKEWDGPREVWYPPDYHSSGDILYDDFLMVIRW